MESINKKFTISELQLLYKIYKMADNYVQSNRVDNDDVYEVTTFYYLLHKFGISDLAQEFDWYNNVPSEEMCQAYFSKWLAEENNGEKIYF